MKRTVTAAVASAPVPQPLPAGTQHVDCSVRHISLNEKNSLWIVSAGAFDLFAVDTDGSGRWTPVGRLTPGTALLAPTTGPRHALVARPLAEAQMLRLSVKDLAARNYGTSHSSTGKDLDPWDRALADGIDRGLGILMDFVREELPPQDFVPMQPGREYVLESGRFARPAQGMAWLEVLDGTLRVSGPTGFLEREAGDTLAVSRRDWITCQSEVRVAVRSTQDLCRTGELLPRAMEQQNLALFMVDRAVERRQHRAERQIAAGRDATEAATDRASRALGGVLDVQQQLHRASIEQADEDPTTAACRAVTEAMGIKHVPTGPRIHTQTGPVEQFAIRARLRTRTISLTGAWWSIDVGPLVGHRSADLSPVALLWARGRYQAWDPVTGTMTAVDRKSAGGFESRAVMFYKPLPEGAVSTWTLVRSGFRGAGADIRLVLVGTVFAVALGALVPLATGAVLGTLVPQARTSEIADVCVLLLLAGVASAAFGALENLALLRVEGRFEAAVQTAVWDRLLRLPTAFFKKYSTGELASAALGVADIRTILTGVTSTLFYSSAAGTVNLAVLLWISPWFAVLALVFTLVGLAVFAALGTRQMVWEVKSLVLSYRLTNSVFEKLEGLPKLRVAAAEDRAYADWATMYAQQKEIQKRIGRYQNGIAAFNAAYPQGCLMLVFLAEASVPGGRISVSAFLSCLAALTIMLTSVTQVTSAVTSAIPIGPIFQRIKPILQHSLEVSSASLVPGELSGRIEVNHLTFGYSKDARPVLDDVSFSVEPGEFVAVVGASGGGKSTLLRLLLGFESPDAGTVLYDGQDLSSLDIAAVRRQCGVVLQRAKPFNGTVLQAITGAANYSLAEAWTAAEMAGVSEDIAAMPMGMHTIITESTLSGGQRQRLAIARALIQRPRLLFFDEATSALDNRTQRIVTDATRQLKATRVVIAHRLSTVMDADRILVLAQGRVSQWGSPAELLADEEGLFHQLVRRQVQ
ncbi:NHLP bacteriocin export ABC transporter permease/ATPase subunit [Streptomyces sp. NPDC001833]|uniref:NHLP bacteriocin export ABC transporter permease/ATPase subunit n=1 Tax=Streptomyces sp. NPDC001833 TaxID=3154658 RepID=UPI003319D014